MYVPQANLIFSHDFFISFFIILASLRLCVRYQICGLIGVFLRLPPKQGQKDDLQIEHERPVFDVIDVVLDAVFDGGVTAPAIYLGPAGNAGFG